MKIIKSSAISGEVSVSDVIAELRRGSRVLLLLRHSERPKIGYEDKTFGASLPLTENGKRLCVEFGRMLAGATPSVEFRASPLLRTVMTAELVAEGMGLAGAEVVRDALVGNGSAYVASELEVWRLFRDGSFFRRMVEYMQAGEQRGSTSMSRLFFMRAASRPTSIPTTGRASSTPRQSCCVRTANAGICSSAPAFPHSPAECE